MATNAFETDIMIGGLSQFDQAAAASAASLKANFDVQLAGISASFMQTAMDASAAFDMIAVSVGVSFQNTILSINTMFTETAAMLTVLFAETFAAIDATILLSATNFILAFSKPQPCCQSYSRKRLPLLTPQCY